jgi:hypothetical protein
MLRPAAGNNVPATSAMTAAQRNTNATQKHSGHRKWTQKIQQLQDIENNDFDNPKYSELLLNIITRNMY